MLFGSIISSPRDILSPMQALELANVYLEKASKSNDPFLALVLCHDTEVSLSQAKKTSKGIEVQVMREGMASAYDNLGGLLTRHGRRDEAQAFYKKAEKLRRTVTVNAMILSVDMTNRKINRNMLRRLTLINLRNASRHSRLTPTLANQLKSNLGSMATTHDDLASNDPAPRHQNQDRDITKIPQAIFARNVRPPVMEIKLPKADERLNTTPQLAACLSLLKHSQILEITLEPSARKWLETIENDADEQERLKALVTNVIRPFQREEIKDSKAVTEVICLAPVLEKGDFQYLLRELCKGIDQSILLDVHQLHGFAQLIHCADPGYLDADDLVKILDLLSTRLRTTHTQSSHHMHQLTMAVSRVLDAMADSENGEIITDVKEWILVILIKLASSTEGDVQGYMKWESSMQWRSSAPYSHPQLKTKVNFGIASHSGTKCWLSISFLLKSASQVFKLQNKDWYHIRDRMEIPLFRRCRSPTVARFEARLLKNVDTIWDDLTKLGHELKYSLDSMVRQEPDGQVSAIIQASILSDSKRPFSLKGHIFSKKHAECFLFNKAENMFPLYRLIEDLDSTRAIGILLTEFNLEFFERPFSLKGQKNTRNAASCLTKQRTCFRCAASSRSLIPERENLAEFKSRQDFTVLDTTGASELAEAIIRKTKEETRLEFSYIQSSTEPDNQ
ncbi:MAG: hypothetical protein J3Q66DRAFT_374914 [Benniella sp.]|nr:MAG: hypothetical protein J3Q66DRAFT_374914 [Benniella sp.]